VRYLLTLHKQEKVHHLCQALLRHIGEENVDLVIAEVFNNHISRKLVSVEDWEDLGAVSLKFWSALLCKKNTCLGAMFSPKCFVQGDAWLSGCGVEPRDQGVWCLISGTCRG
jgi:hypothetical protein